MVTPRIQMRTQTAINIMCPLLQKYQPTQVQQVLSVKRLRRTARRFLHGGHIILATNADGVPLGRRGRIIADVEGFPAHHAVDIGEHFGEGALDVHRLQRRRLHEEGVLLLGEGLGVLGRNGPEVAQVRLVADEHDHDVGVRVVLELPQPPLHVLEGDVPRDVVDDERAYRSTVVGTRDSSVPAGATNNGS
jgi:hypothetical protein